MIANPSNPLIEAKGGSIFAYMARYGKALLEKTQVVEDDWFRKVIGQFEIFDALEVMKSSFLCHESGPS